MAPRPDIRRAANRLFCRQEMYVFLFKCITGIIAWLAKGIGIVVAIFLVFAIYQVAWPRVLLWIKEAEAELQSAVAFEEQKLILEREIAIQEGIVSEQQMRADTLATRKTTLLESIQVKKQAIFNAAKEKYDRKRSELDSTIQEMEANKPGWLISWGPVYNRLNHNAEVTKLKAELKALKLGEATLDAGDVLYQQLKEVGDLESETSKKLESLRDTLTSKTTTLLDVQNRLAILGSDPSLQAELLVIWRKFRPWIAWFLVTIFLGPVLWAVFMYYIVAPVVSGREKLQFTSASTSGLYWSDAKKTFDVRLQPDDRIWIRDNWLSQHDGVSKRTSPWWRWNALGVSLTAGLVPCTVATNKSERPALLSLTSTDPEIEIAEIALEDDAEIVLHPHHAIGFLGPVSVRAQWRLFSLHAWLTGQIRFLVFQGPGSILVAGPRGIDGFYLGNGKPQRISQSLLVGFDTRLSYSVDRTETFWPYLRGKASLFDDCFEGKGTLLRQHALNLQNKSFVERSFGVLFSALGKLLGF